MPDGERAQTGLLLERGDTDASKGSDGEALLLDCGSGVLGNLARTEPGYEGISTVLLTHHHLDHVADLMPLCKARWLAGSEELAIVGPPGTEALVEGLFSVHSYMQDRLDISVREVTPGSFEVGGYSVRAIETRHSMKCLAYRFESSGDGGTETARSGAADPEVENEPSVVTFSADSEAFSELCELADGGTLIHDCSFPDSVDVSNHPTPTQLGEALAGSEATIDRVYLTHLYPHTRGNHEQMMDSIAAQYNGDVRFAQDGLTIEIE
ncbi:MBL fold metallo-hydrolase [Halobacteriales archaeon QS_3_64_16]|nr:MAG: MBL fold metallo-hydrolase [Halobacteriales archaeon QS_3_64_16]